MWIPRKPHGLVCVRESEGGGPWSPGPSKAILTPTPSPASSSELSAVLLWPFMSGLSRAWAVTLVPGDGNSLCWSEFPRLPGSQAQPDLGSRQDWARGQLSTLA